MASNSTLLNYVTQSFEGLVDTITSLEDQLKDAEATIQDQADLIIELQEQINGD